MLISVAICTWNRAPLLRRTLEAMTQLATLPAGVSWELILVDNACTDSTPVVIDEFGSKLPIRRVCEPNPGLSNARNAAIGAASGNFIVWTDDDVLVSPAWLREYAHAFEKYPEAAFFGGPISAWFDSPPPDWLVAVLPQVSGAYAVREFTDNDPPITKAFAPFGANMAFRRDVMKVGSFDPRLGRVGKSAVGGEETSVFRDLMSRGYEGRWALGASVRHYIPAERQTIRYLRRFYAGLAETTARTDPSDSPVRMLFGRPRWAWRATFQYEMTYRVHRLSSPPQVWIEDLKRASLARGALR